MIPLWSSGQLPAQVARLEELLASMAESLAQIAALMSRLYDEPK